MITDLVVVGDRCDFWYTSVASRKRMFHGLSFRFHGRNFFLLGRCLDLGIRGSFPFPFLIILVFFADGPLALSKIINRQSPFKIFLSYYIGYRTVDTHNINNIRNKLKHFMRNPERYNCTVDKENFRMIVYLVLTLLSTQHE